MSEKARRIRERKNGRRRIALLDGAIPEERDEMPPLGAEGVTSLVLDKNHVFSDLYYKKARYKVYWGGRGSAKSWAIAEALIRQAAALPLRILCLREFQNSIKESSHKILSDTIKRLGFESWFTITNDSIKSRVGAEFFFKGCFNKLDSLKSTEGIDICWVEEGHSISEASWRIIIPTIRKEGSEIWVSFNMSEENDATYARLVAKPRPDAIVHKVNYDSNPYFPAVLRAEMEFDRENDYQLFEHVWLGMPRRVSKAIILSGKYVSREFDDDLWKQADRLRFGLDFGFSQDPAALTRSFVLHDVEGKPAAKRLYISHEAYGLGVEIDAMPEWCAEVPGAEDWPVGADSSRPETISHLKNHGIRAYPADKWEGCVEDGIAYLRGFYEIVIHPRCKETLREAYLWRYKVDPKIVDEHGQPQVLPIVVDKHNHTWDSVRYGHDGEIQRGGNLGMWARLGRKKAKA